MQLTIDTSNIHDTDFNLGVAINGKLGTIKEIFKMFENSGFEKFIDFKMGTMRTQLDNKNSFKINYNSFFDTKGVDDERQVVLSFGMNISGNEGIMLRTWIEGKLQSATLQKLQTRISQELVQVSAYNLDEFELDGIKEGIKSEANYIAAWLEQEGYVDVSLSAVLGFNPIAKIMSSLEAA